MSLEGSVVRHYEHGSLGARIDEALAQAGKPPGAALTHEDLAPFDEFHTGGRAATIELGKQIDLPRGARVLDIGSGVGGPSRYFATERGWKVDGIDLTPEYVEVATNLSQRLGLGDAISYRQANASALPFGDATFDGAYMLHVGMNIPDKKAVFAEVRRVLKPGGLFAIYDVMRDSDGAFTYPVPWSSEPATNHLESAAAYETYLGETGFAIVAKRNRRDFAIASMQRRAAQPGAPAPALPIVMGPTAGQKLTNMREMFERGVFSPTEIVSRAA